MEHALKRYFFKKNENISYFTISAKDIKNNVKIMQDATTWAHARLPATLLDRWIKGRGRN